MKKIVILGGGFAGSYCAKQLEKKFEVTLVDSKDHFEFTPGILRTIVNLNYAKKITLPYKNFLKKTKIVLGKVKKVDKTEIIIDSKKIKFDYLVITSGSEYKSQIKNKNMILPNRLKILEDSYKKIKSTQKIIILGGGLVGVELAGEIISKYPTKHITLVHSREKLIPRNSEKTSKKVFYFLKEKGVQIRLNEKIKKIKGDGLVFFCTGISPNLQFINKNLIDKKGIIVNEFMQVKDKKNIFAGGDVTNIPEEKTAQNAERQAQIVVNNILALEKNLPLKKYQSKERPMIISLGKNYGVLEYKNFILTGLIPAILKWIIEKKTMLMMRI